MSKTLCIKPDQHKKTLLKLLFMSHAQTILKLKFSQPYNIRKRVTNLVQLLLVSIMPNAWKTTRITAFCTLFLEGFFASMSSHLSPLCPMHSDRTPVHPYGMRVLGHSYILLSSPCKSMKMLHLTASMHFSTHC